MLVGQSKAMYGCLNILGAEHRWVLHALHSTGLLRPVDAGAASEDQIEAGCW